MEQAKAKIFKRNKIIIIFKFIFSLCPPPSIIKKLWTICNNHNNFYIKIMIIINIHNNQNVKPSIPTSMKKTVRYIIEDNKENITPKADLFQRKLNFSIFNEKV